ncbi:hypothetical protein KAR91_58650 [Candidatus Pacearchaeota archaeon]|nr:hypothetical protein [Candidatus Pacearchaeota archaeon]
MKKTMKKLLILIIDYFKMLIPPKPPAEKKDDQPRICGFKYSTKEDIDKRRKDVMNYKF